MLKAMMVMITAMTPSLKASTRSVSFIRVVSRGRSSPRHQHRTSPRWRCHPTGGAVVSAGQDGLDLVEGLREAFLHPHGEDSLHVLDGGERDPDGHGAAVPGTLGQFESHDHDRHVGGPRAVVVGKAVLEL